MEFENKVVIVTGGSSGIGAATAELFAAKGANVVIVGRNVDKLENVSKKCEENGKKPLVIVADLTDEAAADKVVTSTINTFGKIDILINNAGAGWKSSFLDKNSLEIYDLAEKVNLRQVLLMCHVAAKHLIDSKGVIINVSSICSTKPVSTTWAYCVAKAGLDHFGRCLAIELAPNGVRVNTVNPGPVLTDIVDNMGISGEAMIKQYEFMKQATLLNRNSEAEEIADLIVFLASDKSRGITGSSFVTDNGSLLGAPYKG